MLDIRRPPDGTPWLVAHRGASAVAPENTLAAFRQAAEDGADVVELDVQLSSDGHVVVIHDWHVCRTTDGCGAVARKTLAELKALDAGRWFDSHFAGEPIPTLDEALAWARARTPLMPLMVEFKGGARTLKRGLVERCVQQVNEHEMADHVMFIASHHPHLSRAKAIAPFIATGTISKLNWIDRYILPWLLRRWPNLEQKGWVRGRLLRPLTASQDLDANSLSVPASALTATLIETTHAAGLAVSPGGERWNYPTVIALGADTISADDPKKVREAYLPPQTEGAG